MSGVNDSFELIQAIYQADEIGNPQEIFHLISESVVWQQAKAALDHPDEGYLVGPTLLKGIRLTYPDLQDQVAAQQVILHALTLPIDSLVFAEAQHTVLSYPPSDKDALSTFYRRLETAYLETKDSGDQFIASLALEGLVILSLQQDTNGMIHRTIGTLLMDFPVIPADPEDSAHLPVKAIKLLGHCYDRLPGNKEIATQVKSCSEMPNYAVAAESFFVLGIIYLYDAFHASDNQLIQSALRSARDCFRKSQELEEQRSDAELYEAIVSCYLELLSNARPEVVALCVRKAEKVLIDRLLFLGEATLPAPTISKVEFHIIRLLTWFEKWAEQLSRATQWPAIQPPMHILAEAYAAMREVDNDGILAKVAVFNQNLVMLPQIKNQFLQVQKIRSKLQEVLADENWRLIVAPSEITFYELALEALGSSSSPKDLAAAKFDNLLAAAKKSNPQLARHLQTLQEQGLDADEIIVRVVLQDIEAKSHDVGPEPAYPQVQTIVERLLPDLNEGLNWGIKQQLVWHTLVEAVKLAAHYFYRLYCANREEKLGFLFQKANGKIGLGKDARESHLENHFYDSTRFSYPSVAVDKQPKDITPGRPDLGFHYRDIWFPVEVKCEDSDITRENIRGKYIAQAQSYASAQHQVSFLFVLDTTEKTLGVPFLMNYIDYCYVDRILVPNAITPTYVIVFIFPGNRPTPSEHSWA